MAESASFVYRPPSLQKRNPSLTSKLSRRSPARLLVGSFPSSVCLLGHAGCPLTGCSRLLLQSHCPLLLLPLTPTILPYVLCLLSSGVAS
ncbi:hypothetical protein P170DRAFT_240693 [Aspergillus steynii IBT 23096]|uniref:Uncharacterized protein n=1 Tax=Aspergillus steynii IBT 23096 TaxID=1392250 RepID=A0A2I2G3G4_9EURO|nr:uncharacterized protein P170DRAFT_240693 [Aspergillus steynii IBT 23096]PLB47416.1 hypothetical protein P170DRAFT_240693 [Aspergillus steynii IBT 23096]